jgi:serine/threonine protein kinase
MSTPSLDDRLDAIVARYAERLARGDRRGPEDLLAEVPAAQRAEVGRCLRLLEVGLQGGVPAPAPIGPGSVFDGFRIERELGRGGMAVVYLARQLELNRPVALKVMRPGLALDERHVARFRREALAVARLSHPHIVQIHAVGVGCGHPYLAMEYVEGPSLADVFAKLPPAGERTAEDLARLVGWSPERAADKSFEMALAELLAPAARALATAHEVGLVHRDIKPSNILIRKDSSAVIADFGLAKGDGDPSLSLSGEPLGTPYYMSPEQATMVEARVDQRTDVYSLGVVLYEGLAGERPFEGATLVEILDAVRRNEPKSLRMLDRRTSANAQSLVRRAMSREREGRYPSGLELAVDLSALARAQTTQARAQEGGRWRRGWSAYRAVMLGEREEFRSDATFLGWPLVHIKSNVGKGHCHRVAKGWIAIGPKAVGAFAMGGTATGLFAFGGLTFSLVGCGGLSVGLIAIGGMAVGGFAFGGGSAGYAAVGGAAAGYYACAGEAWGVHVISNKRKDPEAVDFFKGHGWAVSVFGVRIGEELLEK